MTRVIAVPGLAVARTWHSPYSIFAATATTLRCSSRWPGAALIKTRLAPGGTVVVVRDHSSWPVTRVELRHVFQVGGRGGTPRPRGHRPVGHDVTEPAQDLSLPREACDPSCGSTSPGGSSPDPHPLQECR